MIKNKNNNIIMTDEENKKKTQKISSINKNSNIFLISFTTVIFIIAIISLIQDDDIKYTSFIYVLVMFFKTSNDAWKNDNNPFDNLNWIRKIFYDDNFGNIDKNKKNRNTLCGYFEIGILAIISLSGVLTGNTFIAFFIWTFIIVYLVTNLLLMKLNKIKNSLYSLKNLLAVLWFVGLIYLGYTFIMLLMNEDYLEYDYGGGLIAILSVTTVAIVVYISVMLKFYLVDLVEVVVV